MQVVNASSPGVSYQWYLNGQLQATTAENPLFTFTNASHTQDSIIQIKLVVTAGTGCKDSVTQTVTVYPRPLAQFSIPSPVCATSTVTAVNTSQGKGLSYQWYVNDPAVLISNATTAAPTFTFPDNQTATPITYTISLAVTSTDGCKDSAWQAVVVNPRPTAAFQLPAPACSPAVLQPTNQSTGSGLQYAWSITPAVSSTGLNTATPTFNLPLTTSDSAVYTLKLVVTDANGCVDSLSKQYWVYPKPKADFTASADTVCDGVAITFVSTSSSNQSGFPQVSHQWNFGNGQTSTDSLPVPVLFTNSGTQDTTYTVRLIVTNAFGCVDTVYKNILVRPNARAQLQVNAAFDCAPFKIDTSVVKAVPYPFANATYTWKIFDKNFNVLSTQTGQHALNHTIVNDGDTVYVRLVVSSLYGCKADSVTQMMYTIVNPVASFSVPTSGCSPLQVQVVNASSPGVSYQWYLNGQLQTTTAENPLFTLLNNSHTQDSTIVVKLVVTAGTGCKDSVTQTVTVYPRPLAQFSIPSPVCATSTVTASNTSQGKGLSYQWYVNNPAVLISNATAAAPTFTFPDNQTATPITYAISLAVTSTDDCKDSAWQAVVVNPRPTAAFQLPAPACSPKVLQPTNQSSGSGLQYAWSITPAVSSTGLNTATPTFNLPLTTNDSVVYTLKLVVTDANGCVDSLSKQYWVYPKPKADFTASADTVCDGVAITFVSTSSSNQNGVPQLSHQWNFGNGQTSTDSLPSPVVFVNTGIQDTTYTVRLIVTNAFGCLDTVHKNILVRPNPIAQLDTGLTVACAPFTIDSTNIKAIVYPLANGAYTWQVINNNQILATFNGHNAVNYTMTSDGDTVIIRLIATSLFGCGSDTADQLFITIPNPNPGFVLSDTAGCHPLTVQITDTSSAGVTYQWYVNGVLSSTVKNPQFTLTNTSFTTDSIYTIKLVITSIATGCKDSTVQTVKVYARPLVNFQTTEACHSFATQFTDLTTTVDTIIQRIWILGNGDTLFGSANPSYTYAVPGVYNVTLIAVDSRGCSNFITQPVIVRPNPVANFFTQSTCGQDTLCIGQPFALISTSTIDSTLGGTLTYQWDILNNGTIDYTSAQPTHTFTQTGTFPIKLRVISQYGCVDSVVKNVYVIQPPIAKFSLSDDSICGSVNIGIIDSSSGRRDFYYWEIFVKGPQNNEIIFYTDSNPNLTQGPLLTPSYNNTDTTYYVRLTVGNCCGISQALDSVVVIPIPVPDFQILPDSGCSPLTVTLQLDGLIPPNADSLTIDFGFNNQKTSVTPTIVQTGNGPIKIWGQPSFTYTYTGTSADTTYYITLRAFNACGDTTKVLPVKVAPNTVQAFFQSVPNIGCEPLTVNFQNLSFGASFHSWCFDYNPVTKQCNGQTSVAQNPSYTYPVAGTYTAALFATNGCGYDTIMTQIQVFPSPIADFIYNNNVCAGDTVFFTNTSIFPQGQIVQYNWNFGNGQTSNLINPYMVYNQAGTYNVCLYIQSNTGCGDSVCYPVTVFGKSSINFYAQNKCFIDQPIQFFDSTSSAGVIQTIWKFGDGNTSIAANPQHTYSAPGIYQVTLIKQINQGCIDSITKPVHVYPMPTAAFAMQLIAGDSCNIPQTYKFINQSQGAFGFQWDFNFNNNPGQFTSVLNEPTFTYSQPGVYQIRLIATNGYGCTDTAYRTIIIGNGVFPDFTPDSAAGCVPLTVHFQDASIYSVGIDTVKNWHWNFGDGNTLSGIPNPTHTYTIAGKYTVTLTVEMASGCIDSVTKNGFVDVYHRPEVNFDILFESLRRIRLVNYTFEGGVLTNYEIDFGDGTTSKDSTHQYDIQLLGRDSIQICLKATNSLGCDSTLCKRIWLWKHQLDVPNAFAPDLTEVGEGNVFLPKGHNLKEYHLRIYDAWGNLIFESRSLDDKGSPNEPWDGRHKGTGNVLPMGAYVWTIHARFNDNTLWEGKLMPNGERLTFGTVTLIR
ncbi:PKD domain-containing protein [Thermaurantimonas sp.]|uniref:PKD domain-containing protein n=1 Tax=Thermaurantimonas sp. TaxID=2681568 RepID=UPI00391C66BF